MVQFQIIIDRSSTICRLFRSSPLLLWIGLECWRAEISISISWDAFQSFCRIEIFALPVLFLHWPQFSSNLLFSHPLMIFHFYALPLRNSSSSPSWHNFISYFLFLSMFSEVFCSLAHISCNSPATNCHWPYPARYYFSNWLTLSKNLGSTQVSSIS